MTARRSNSVSKGKAAIAKRLPGYVPVPAYTDLERRHYGVER